MTVIPLLSKEQMDRVPHRQTNCRSTGVSIKYSISTGVRDTYGLFIAYLLLEKRQ